MTAEDEFTRVERRLAGLRDGDGVDQADVEALLDSSDPVDRRAGLKGLVLTATGEYDCFTEGVPSLEPHLTDADPNVRYNALQAVIELLPARDDLLADAPVVASRLDDDSDRVAEKAIDAMAAVAKTDAEAAADAADAVADYLDADRSEIRKRAVWFFAVLAQDRPADATPAVPRLADLVGDTYETPELDGDEWTTPLAHEQTRQDIVAHGHEEGERHMTIREFAAEVLIGVAGERPDDVRQHAGTLRGHLTKEDPHVRRQTLRALTALGDAHPEAVSPAVDEIISCLDADDADLVAAAVKPLALVVEDDPDRVVPDLFDHVDRLVGLLDHADPHVRGTAAGLLSHVADRDPAAVEPGEDALADLLADDRAFVRGNAVWALESLGTGAAAAALRERREAEPDEEVRASIDHALDGIE